MLQHRQAPLHVANIIFHERDAQGLHKTHGRAFFDAEICDSKAVELHAGDVATVQPTGMVHEVEAEFDATVRESSLSVGATLLSYGWTGGRGRRFANARYCASTSSR